MKILRSLALTLALAAVAAPASAQTVEEVSGTWALADDDAEATIDRAIRDVTSDMSFFLRPIANDRLDAMIDPNPTLRVRRDGEDVLFTMDDWTVRLPLGGPVVDARAPDGTALRIRASLAHGRLVIEQAAEDGTRILYLKRQGEGLVMAARIQSERLPRDVTYRLRYRRASEGRVARR